MKYWDHYGVVEFDVGAPDPFGALGDASEENAFAVQQLALSVGAANDQVIATGVTVRDDAACVKVQWSLHSHLNVIDNVVIVISHVISSLLLEIRAPTRLFNSGL